MTKLYEKPIVYTDMLAIDVLRGECTCKDLTPKDSYFCPGHPPPAKYYQSEACTPDAIDIVCSCFQIDSSA
jgi:hypothetical protein